MVPERPVELEGAAAVLADEQSAGDGAHVDCVGSEADDPELLHSGWTGDDLPADAEVARGVFVHVLADVAGSIGVLDLGGVVAPGLAFIRGDGQLGPPMAKAQQGPEFARVGIARDIVDAAAGVARQARPPQAVLLFDDEDALARADQDA
jgi:hypothetical protein